MADPRPSDAHPRRPEIQPMETDERIPIGLGTAAWVVALIVLLALRDRLPADQRWWIWTCVAGACGGVFGLWYVPRLRRRQRDTGH